MKNNILIISVVCSLILVSCGDQDLNPTQTDPGADTVVRATHTNSPSMMVKKAAGGPITAAGVLSSFGIDEAGDMECIMESEITDANVSEFRVSAHSGSQGASVTSRKQGSGNANIIVTYLGFTPEAQAAFQSAVDIWAQKLNSDVDIYVLAQFAPLGEGVLGSAGSTFIIRDFPGAQRETWYGNALGDKLAGEDLVPGYFDIVANFSSQFPNWYFGTDGNTPEGDFDFRTVVLHELGHGLNFFGGMTFNATTGIGSYGFGISPSLPTIYDRYANTRPGKQLVKTNKFPNPSTMLGMALIGEQILFSGPNTIVETKGARATLYTPDSWRQGSSYSHLDEVMYSGTIDGLMTPFLARGEAYNHPGPLVMHMFNDMGWNDKIVKPYITK